MFFSNEAHWGGSLTARVWFWVRVLGARSVLEKNKALIPVGSLSLGKQMHGLPHCSSPEAAQEPVFSFSISRRHLRATRVLMIPLTCFCGAAGLNGSVHSHILWVHADVKLIDLPHGGEAALELKLAEKHHLIIRGRELQFPRLG